MEQLLRKVVAEFENRSRLKVDCLLDFHAPFPSDGDLMLELAIVDSDMPAFVRFRENGELLDWGRIVPSGRAKL